MATKPLGGTTRDTNESRIGVMTAEDKIRHRIRELERWLRTQGIDVRQEQRHLDENSRERLYWHYGYLVGLRDALNAMVREEALPLH